MAGYADTYPEGAVLIARKFFKEPGTFDFAVPASSTFVRASAVGVGGQGDGYGGGAAFARSRVLVTPGENLKIRVGNPSTDNANGDSYVRRNDNITNIVYAERGRGGVSSGTNGAAGLAANSIGDIRRDGAERIAPNQGGAAATDASDYGAIIMGPIQGNPSQVVVSPGSGGYRFYWLRSDGSWPGNPNGYLAYNAGLGEVCLEFFNTDPGF